MSPQSLLGMHGGQLGILRTETHRDAVEVVLVILDVGRLESRVVLGV